MSEEAIPGTTEGQWETAEDIDARGPEFLKSLGIPQEEYRRVVEEAFTHALAAPADPAAERWVPVGPRNLGGAIRCLAQHPDTPDVILAGSSQGGVWKSIDGGLVWRPIGPPDQAVPVGSLVYSPFDANLVFVGSGEDFTGGLAGRGLFISTDAGATFTRLISSLTGPDTATRIPGASPHYARIAFDPRLDVAAGAGTVTTAGTTVTLAGGAFTGVVVAGDFLRIAGQTRLVSQVTSPTLLTVDRAFSPDFAAPTAWERAGHRYWLATPQGLWRFEPGVGFLAGGIRLASGAFGNCTDVVVAQDPVQPDVVAVFAGLSAVGVFRGEFNRIQATAGAGTISSAGTTVNGAGGAGFLTPAATPFFAPGDIITAAGQSRVISVITSNTQLSTLTAFDPPVPAGTAYQRLKHTAWTQPNLPRTNNTGTMAAGGISRVRVAVSRNHAGAPDSSRVYCIMQDRGLEGATFLSHPTRVYRSSDFGRTWRASQRRVFVPASDNGQAFYNLVLEVHPNNRDLLLVGDVNLFRSIDGGDHWTVVLDWEEYDRGDRAQHGDQHCVMFDAVDPDRVWVANDGGISRHEGRVLDPTWTGWRKRSHGILAAQFFDLAVHPRWPFIYGGGLQDNGTFISFGGPTWYRTGWGDGGFVAFERNDPQLMYMAATNGWTGEALVHASNMPAPPNTAAFNRLPIPGLPDQHAMAPNDTMNVALTWHGNLRAASNGPFTGIFEHHPSQANHLLFGRVGSLWLTTDGGATFTNLNVPFFVGGTPPEVSAIAYSPNRPNTDWWVGTDQGEVFRTQNGAAGPWANVTPFWMGGSMPRVSRIAAFPTNIPAPNGYRVVVSSSSAMTDFDSGSVQTAGTTVTGVGTNFNTFFQPGDTIQIDSQNRLVTAVANALSLTVDAAFNQSYPAGTAFTKVRRREVFLSDDFGANWNNVSDGRLENVPPSPISALAFDPADARTLFVGTLAGVYVTHDLPAPGAVAPIPAPTWRTWNLGLPLVLVSDLEIVPIINTLRAGTFGRGMYECNLTSTVAADRIPDVRLNIRSHVMEDGRPWADVPADDPRLAPAWWRVRTRAGAGTIATVGTAVTGTGTSFNSPAANRFFRPGDLFYAAGELRTVTAVASNTQLTLDSAMPAPLPAGTAYRQIRSAVGAGTVLSSGNTVLGLATTFTTPAANPFFRAGDIIAAGNQIREVSRVDSPTLLTTTTPFSPVLPAGTAYRKVEAVMGLGLLTSAGVTVTGQNSLFNTQAGTSFISAGNLILARGQIREVAAVASESSLTTTAAFNPVLTTTGIAPLDFARAIDIRVDAPDFRRFDPHRFGESLDGVEFDDTLLSDDAIAGEINYVYVQVHNRGAVDATNVDVHLFYAPAPGTPAAAPDVWPGIPADPLGASEWKRAAPTQTLGVLSPGQPVVVRFPWQPLLSLTGNAALLSVTTNGQDGGAMAAVVTALDFVRQERRAAMRILPVRSNAIYLRDGVDDDGRRGAVAWSGRSPDIVVRQAHEADPDGAFADLADPRFADRVVHGQNFIYVRMFNRSGELATGEVTLYQVSLENPGDLAQWHVIQTVTITDIPARGWKFSPEILWTPTDPGPDDPPAFMLAAVARQSSQPGPDLGDISSIPSFWYFVRTGGFADKVALRALRFQP